MTLGIPASRAAAPERTPIFPEASLTALNARYGASVAAELRALASESDPTLAAEGLLNLAQRQEQAGRAELAVELYGRVAQDEGAGSALRARAQSHLDAITGRGAFGARAEFLLRNFSQQASDPTMLFAMGAAGAVFRLTRLGVLSRLATSTNPGLWTRLLGAGRVASLAGFAVEAPTFTLAGRLGNAVLGREQEWSTRALGRELASSYLVLGGLKLMGGVAGRLANGQAAPLRAALQQGGMLTGILLGHRAEEWAGLRRHQDGATTLIDSLALLLQFNVAGRLSRHAFGENFTRWERQLDLQAEALTRAQPHPLAERLPQLHPGLVLASSGNSGPRNPRSPFSQILMMTGDGGENGGRRVPDSDRAEPESTAVKTPRRRRDADRTLPFITLDPAKAETIVKAEGGRDPLEVDSPTQLIRRIQDPELNFREILVLEDVTFHVKAPPEGETGPLSRLERYIPPLLQYLNAISIGASVPNGRRVIIEQLGEGTLRRRFNLVRMEHGEAEGRRSSAFECVPPLAETEEAAEVRSRKTPPAPAPETAEPRLRKTPPAPAPEAVEEPRSQSLRETVEAILRPVESNVEPEAAKLNPEVDEARSIPLRTQLLESLPRVLALSARQAQRRSGSGLVLLEQEAVSLAALQDATRILSDEVPDGAVFKVFVAESRNAFRGVVQGRHLTWEPLPDETETWSSSTIFSSATVRSVVEVYQLLAAYSRSEQPAPSPELIFRFRGPSPARDTFAEFIASALDRHPLQGRDRFRVEFSEGELDLGFHRTESGRWERD